MLTDEQLDILEQYIEADPAVVALKTREGEVARQVAVLQKARTKLPSFYNARCFITNISYEQCTSEIVAANRRLPKDELAVDLTCGLGVDTVALSRNFKHVVACEIDPEKAKIARWNFDRLNIRNVEVVCVAAEDFLTSFNGKADLLFCDPSRRSDNGSKLHALQDCSPNIIRLMPRLMEVVCNIIVKLSPLFDVAELFNIFGNDIEVETISHNNECKEVVMRFGENVAAANHLSITVIRGEKVFHQSYKRNELPANAGKLMAENARYIYIPDVALVKSRTVGEYMAENFAQADYLYDSFMLTDILLEGFEGRGFAVRDILDYKPKAVKRYLADKEVGRAIIHTKNFPYNVSEIKRQLGVNEGVGCELFCFRLSGEATIVVADTL